MFDKEFKEELICNLNVLWKLSIFCDIIIRVEGEDFFVYWCVLIVVSFYFWVLFILIFKENENNFVEFKEVKCEVLSEVF